MKNKGITLVALVVTIIVLVILAGVSINLVLGDNGIVSKSKLAKENYEIAANEEQVAMDNYEEEITQIAGTREGLSEQQIKALIAEEVAKQVNAKTQPFEMEEIGRTNSTSFVEINVPGGIDQYKYLYFVFGQYASEEVYGTYIKDTQVFKANNNSTSSPLILYFYPKVDQYSRFYYLNDNTICAKVTSYACRVYGIK